MCYNVYMRGINNIKRSKSAFSLAEMLLVLLIMSFLSMAIAPFVTKKVKKDTYRQPHGRFECFWNNDRLIQYNVLETGAGQQEDRTAQGYCEFEPVERAAFYLLQGVGGGGGGAFAATQPYITSYTATYTSTDTDGYSVTGYYIPCSRIRYSNSYSSCSSRIISSFTDSSIESNTASQWAWVNEIWDDPEFMPTRTFKICSGRGGGGEGIGGWTQEYIPAFNPETMQWYNKCEYEPHIPPDANGVDNDPCYDYPTADGGNGGKGACVTVTVALPRGSVINRSNLNYYFSSDDQSNGADVYATFGNASCKITGGGSGSDGRYSPSVGWTQGETGQDAQLYQYLEDDEHQCNYTLGNYITGGRGGSGVLWNTVNGSISWDPKPGDHNSNNSFSFSGASTPYVVPISYTYKKAYNYYGMAGGPGEYNMMFFSELNKKIRITPGRAGRGGIGSSTAQQGQPGGTTTATFDGDAYPFLTLDGGRGARNKMTGNYFSLYSQDPVYQNDSVMETTRLGEYSDFVAALSADEGTNLQSIIPSQAKPGRGGDGGFTVLRDTRNGGTRSFDGHTLSATGDERFEYGGENAALPTNSGKEISCNPNGPLDDEHQTKISGTTTNCPGEDGEDGAVIIIW